MTMPPLKVSYFKFCARFSQTCACGLGKTVKPVKSVHRQPMNNTWLE